MKKPTRRRPLARLQAYLTPELRTRLAQHCSAHNVTESAAVREALEHHLDGTSDFALVLRRLDRLSRGLDRLERDQELSAQAFAMFVRLWLAHTPRLPREARPAARASAEARFKQFLDHVAERFASGKRFVDDLPQERIADDDELAAIAEGVAGGPTSDRGRGPAGTPLPA
jgi:predicted DNA-binding protein